VEAVTIACPTCNESGCDDCVDGYFELNECPKQFCGNKIGEFIMHAELTQKGMPPIAGGTLDQSASFMDAASYYWAEMDRAKAESYK